MALPPDETPRPARFLLDGRVVEAADALPTTTLLQYLRGPLGRCGTKEGCAEGDCGACTVVIGEPHGEGMRYRAVNSCIRFVPTLDGKEVVTVDRAPFRAATVKLHNGPDATWSKDVYDRLQALK